MTEDSFRTRTSILFQSSCQYYHLGRCLANSAKMQNLTISVRSEDVIDFAFYRYDPSMAGAVIFTLLFIGTTFYHIFQMFRTKTWYFVPFVIGGTCMYSCSVDLEFHADISSRNCRIYRACRIKQTESGLDSGPLHRADTMSSPRPSSFSSFNLHAARPHHPGSAGRIACNCEKEVAHQDFRCW